MRTLRWSDNATIDLLEKELQKGAVVLGDGDTVLGLLADVSLKGVVKLDHIKKRFKKPYLVLVHDHKKALNLIDYDERQFFQIEKLMNICWPGPVTIIFKAKRTLPAFMKAEDGTIALRVPDHAPLLQLLERFDGLFSTSANSSGQDCPRTIEQVDEDILHDVSCIVRNDVHEDAHGALPSTIIDCSMGNSVRVVRQGVFEIGQLSDIFGNKCIE